MCVANCKSELSESEKAWEDWKAGHCTELAMIENAKNDLIRHVQDELTLFDEEDTVMETDLEEPLQEKKEQLKMNSIPRAVIKRGHFVINFD